MKKDKVKTGTRLGECLEFREITQAELIRKLNKKNGYKKPGYDYIKKQNLNGTIRQGKPISDEKLVMIAEVLNIHVGYLLGDDNYQCESYSEYLEYEKLSNDANFSKYSKLLKYADLLLSGSSTSDGNTMEYRVTQITDFGPMSKDFSETSMELFYQRIIESIRRLFDDYTDQVSEDLTKDDWVRYLNWHPNFWDEKTKQILVNNLKEGDADD